MTTWIDRIHSPQKSWGMCILCSFFYLLSLVYGFVVRVRNFLYDQSWLKIYTSKAVVISIGNIVAGGVGKTPLTLKIAETILNQNIPLAILSRGYLSQFEHEKVSTVLSRGEGPLFSSKLCGDEPYLISKNLPKALFIVGKDRVQSARKAEELHAKIILLDDAMQHRRLHRNLEIIVLDAGDPFGKGYFLPRGFLREPLRALKRADLIVINHVNKKEDVESLLQKLRLVSNAPTILTEVKVRGFYDLQDKKQPSLKGIKVAAFCGLAKPHYFYETLKQEGAQVLLKKNLSDHAGIQEKALEAFCVQALTQGVEFVVCSEKDAVKISRKLKYSLPIVQIKIDLNIIDGEAEFQNMFKKLDLKL